MVGIGSLRRGRSGEMKLSLLLILTALSLFAEPATLMHIADGDTMTYKTASGEKVTCRVAYIDTPEMFATAKLAKDAQKAGISPEQIQKAGWAASDYAKNVLGPVGRKHNVVTFEKDKYGRSLCEIYDEQNVLYSAKIVLDGYAVVLIWLQYLVQTIHKIPKVFKQPLISHQATT